MSRGQNLRYQTMRMKWQWQSHYAAFGVSWNTKSMNKFSYIWCEDFMGTFRYPGCSVLRNTSPRQDENHLPCRVRWWSSSGRGQKVRNVLQPSTIKRYNRAVSMSGHHVTSSTILSASVWNKFRKSCNFVAGGAVWWDHCLTRTLSRLPLVRAGQSAVQPPIPSHFCSLRFSNCRLPLSFSLRFSFELRSDFSGFSSD